MSAASEGVGGRRVDLRMLWVLALVMTALITAAGLIVELMSGIVGWIVFAAVLFSGWIIGVASSVMTQERERRLG